MKRTMTLQHALEKDTKRMQEIDDPDLLDIPSACYLGTEGIAAEVYEQKAGRFGVNIFRHGSVIHATQNQESLLAIAQHLERFQIPVQRGWNVGWITPM